MISIAEWELDGVDALLVALCRRDVCTSVQSVDLEPLADASFRHELRNLAASHRIAGLVLRTLKRAAETDKLPTDLFEDLLAPGDTALHRSLLATRDRSRSFAELRTIADEKDRELGRLLDHFRGAGVELVVLKGPALRRVAYDDPVDRRYGDYDLLFCEGDVDRAISIVAEDGYRCPYTPEQISAHRELHFHVLLRRERKFRAEIHWGLTKPRGGFFLDPDEFRRHSRQIEGLAGEGMRIPCTEHLVLHAAYDNLRDTYSRLARIVDVDRAIAAAPEFDWEFLVSQARQSGTQWLLALSLELARKLLGTPIPPEVLNELRPGPATRLHLRLARTAPSMLRQQFRVPGASPFFLMWMTPGWKGRLHQLWRGLRGRHSNFWFFREGAAGPPSRFTTFVAGLAWFLRLARFHVQLYLRSLLTRLSQAAGWERVRAVGSATSPGTADISR